MRRRGEYVEGSIGNCSEKKEKWWVGPKIDEIAGKKERVDQVVKKKGGRSSNEKGEG
jgi:hypothetical protein